MISACGISNFKNSIMSSFFTHSFMLFQLQFGNLCCSKMTCGFSSFFLSLTKVCNPLQDLNLGIFDWQAAYTLWSMLKPCPRIFVILLFMNDIIEGNGGQSSILLNSETTICIEPGKVTIEETTASTYHKTNFRTFRCREHISIIANNNLTYSSLELAILSVYQVSFSTWII